MIYGCQMGNTVGSFAGDMLTERQRATIIGTLLGDGHLERNGRNVRLKIDHGHAQREFVWWKYRELRDITSKEPICVSVYDKRTGRIYRHWRFSTLSLPVLEPYWNIFYCGRRKRIPQNILEVFNSPLSLAVWYMDDGYLRKDCKALHLNTQGYSEEEQLALVGCLKNNFGIETKVHWAAGRPKLYIPSREVEKFCGIIQSHLAHSMYWKLPDSPVTTDPETRH